MEDITAESNPYPCRKGPHVVEINIQRKESRITGSVEKNAIPQTLGLSPLNGDVRHGYVTVVSKNSNNGYAVQRVSKNGFRVKRYLPRHSEPDLTETYVSESRIVNSASLEGFLNRRLRQSEGQPEIPAIYELPPSINSDTDTNHTIKTSVSADRVLLRRNMSDEPVNGTLGVTNPNFMEDTEAESDIAGQEIVKENGKENVKTNGDVILDIDKVCLNGSPVQIYTPKVNKVEEVTVAVGSDAEKTISNPTRNGGLGTSGKYRIEEIFAKAETTPSLDPNKNTQIRPLQKRKEANRGLGALLTKGSKLTLNKGFKNKFLVTTVSHQALDMYVGKRFLKDQCQFSEKQITGRALMYTKKKGRQDEDSKWLEWMEKKFKEIAGADGQIDLDEFKKALGVRKSFFAERFFQLFDQDHSDAIELGELMDGLRMLTKGTPAQKLQFLFDVYDADSSGSIDRDELKEVLKACMEESSLSLTEENIDDLTDVLFEAADEDESGEITFDELRKELEKHPGVIENLTISAAQWLKPPGSGGNEGAYHRYLTAEYYRNNIRKVAYFGLYVIVNVLLFILAVFQYRESNGWVQVARGCGLCLNFNGMWVLVLMLRKCLTFLRMTKLNRVLPLDQHIMFHKLTGFTIAGLSLVHSLAHIANTALAGNGKFEMWEMLFTTKANVGFVDGSAYITGWLLDLVLVIMVICSLPFVRRGGHFQVFYWTHMLYVVFWILMLLHGPQFWKWFIVPGVLFILEKVFRSKLIKMARYGDTFIEEVNLLPSKVTHLVITRPLSFKYQPGDYIFIQIPAIAKQEWHPFTISSAPEMEGSIWLHVRSAGHWTNKLFEYFDNLEVKDDDFSNNRRTTKKKFEKLERAYSRRTASKRTGASSKGVKPKLKHKTVKVKCFIDGPYGTGTREVFNVQHAVLVGAGIGVTPMASILQSVWYKFNETRTTCPKCTHVWYNEDETEDMKLKKVDFIWINRDQKSFEWFLTLLNQLEIEQGSHHGALENCIQTHLYMTAAQKKTDMKGIGLQIALDLMYEKSHVDLITGLKTKTNPGRPDWNDLFSNIKRENKGKVKVFFCGAPALGKLIKEAAERQNFAFSKENF